MALDESRPMTHPADVAIANGASEFEALFANALLLHAILVEVAVEAGGELRLKPGFGERFNPDETSMTAATGFDEETGEYVIRAVETPESYRGKHQGAGVTCGSFWRQDRGMDRAPSPRYRVARVKGAPGAQVAVMETRVGLEVEVPAETLLRGLEGWRRAEGE